MIIIGILFIVIVFAMIKLQSDNSEKVMKEFCDLECKKNINNKYKFCC